MATASLPKLEHLPALFGIAVTATLGQLLLTSAYRHAQAAIVAAASYVSPIWGLAADLVIFSVFPPLSAILGGAVIVAAGLGLLRRSPGRPQRAPQQTRTRVQQVFFIVHHRRLPFRTGAPASPPGRWLGLRPCPTPWWCKTWHTSAAPSATRQILSELH